MCLSTRMLPRAPNSSPAALARPLSGETPMARMTISAAMAGPTSTFVTTCPSFSSKPVTAQPSRSATPPARNLAWTKAAMSASSGLKSCSIFSTMVTFAPRSARFSAISSPMKPPPTTVAEAGRCSSTNSRMKSASSTVRRVKMFFPSMPGSGGTTGRAPGESTSLS